MYNNGIAPLGMGVGAGVTLPFLEMSLLWVALATFALIACASAVNRTLPKFIVKGQDWPEPKQQNRGPRYSSTGNSGREGGLQVAESARSRVPMRGRWRTRL